MAQKKSTAKKPVGRPPASSKSRQAAAKKPIRREIGALIFFFLAVFGILGYFKIDAIFINFFVKLLGGLTGWGFYAYPPMFLAASVILAMHRGRPVRMRVVCAMLMPVALGSLLFLLFGNTEYNWSWSLFPTFYNQGAALGNAGVITGLMAMALKTVFSKIGAIIVYIVITVFLSLITFNITISNIILYFKERERPQYEPQPEEPRQPREPREPKEPRGSKKSSLIDIPVDDPEALSGAKGKKKETDEMQPVPVKSSGPIPFVFGDPVNVERKSPPAPEERLIAAAESNNLFSGDVPFEPVQDERAVPDIPAAPPATAQSSSERKAEVAQAAEEIQVVVETRGQDKPKYIKPPIDLLYRPQSGSVVDGTEEMRTNSMRLNDALRSFSIDAHIVNYTRGPSVTRYEVELEQGVKLTKLTGLANDLALSLGASSVRVAPIPNKISVVGVEVPNKLVTTVYIRDVISSQSFKASKSKLAFALGKDIGGNCIIGDISKLPHLLIAGTTGSGKSVCMNSLIISLLYNASPDDVRLVMIDPKMIELGGYNGIPHLLIPVVTDPKKAAGALQWAVNEMMKRYRLFAEAGVKDLDSYNEAAAKQHDREKLYRIVIVIDELADLMLVAAKEVEEYICRIAQMARAAGMHLVIATQRPSANVITGIMKANIPSRIAFAVASQMESRIILDTSGAEKLVGRGDMLYYPLGAGKPTRIQGTMISGEEVESVVEFIKQSAEPDYSDEIINQIEKHGREENGDSRPDTPEDSGDELLPAAIEVILDTGQASVSMLQRRLKLGYSRAARLVDQMEERGIVGPFEGSKPRQLLITREQWQQKQMGSIEMLEPLPDLIEED